MKIHSNKKNNQSLFFNVSLFLLFLTFSCQKETGDIPAPVAAFTVGNEISPVYAGTLIPFINGTDGGEEFMWDFGDNETSNHINPYHVYKKPGEYTVVLTVNNVHRYQKKITIGPASIQLVGENTTFSKDTAIVFQAIIFNPDKEKVIWDWSVATASDATINLNDVTMDSTQIDTLKEEIYSLSFNISQAEIEFHTFGHIDLTLKATVSGITYEQVIPLEIREKLNKRLYIARKNGNIYYTPLTDTVTPGLVNLNISAGFHPLTLSFYEGRIYVFDGGSKVTFSAVDEDDPGSIKSFLPDGTGLQTHIAFSTRPNDDAFAGSISDGNIYFVNRRFSATKIPVETLGVTWSSADVGDYGDDNPVDYPALVTNTRLGYYNQSDFGGSYVAGGSFKIYNQQYWWAKHSLSRGIWRFTDEDILTTGLLSTELGEVAPPDSGGILTDYAVKAFEIDDVNDNLYFSSNAGANIGFYVSDLEGTNVRLIDDSPPDSEGGENEPVYITGIAIDTEEGYVYWAYRGPKTPATDLEKSGIKRYKLDGTGKVEYFVKDIEAYGIAIDPTLR